MSLPAADAIELRQLVDRYADAVDRRDGPAVAGLFAPDGVLRVQADGGPIEAEFAGAGVAGVLETLVAYHRTFHHVGGAVFEAGPAPGGASGRVQCIAHHYERTGNGPVDLEMMIHYHDRYSRETGRWLIAERRVAIEWTELHPAHPVRRAPR